MTLILSLWFLLTLTYGDLFPGVFADFYCDLMFPGPLPTVDLGLKCVPPGGFVWACLPPGTLPAWNPLEWNYGLRILGAPLRTMNSGHRPHEHRLMVRNFHGTLLGDSLAFVFLLYPGPRFRQASVLIFLSGGFFL